MAIHPVHGYAIPPPQDVKVSRRNARERNRVKTVNDGFEKLKRSIPAAATVKKLSKVRLSAIFWMVFVSFRLIRLLNVNTYWG